MKKSAREKRNETLKKRYQVYRRLGYDSYTARALSHRSLNVSQLEISKKTGKLKRNHKTKVFIDKNMKEWQNKKAIDNYTKRIEKLENDTIYSKHGMLTKDKRYRGENGKIVSIIKHENKLTTNQAYYFFYFMTQNDMSYSETKKQLLSNKEFEEYDKRKHMRIARQKSKSMMRKQKRKTI